jgi:hypothetical protein
MKTNYLSIIFCEFGIQYQNLVMTKLGQQLQRYFSVTKSTLLPQITFIRTLPAIDELQ